MYKDNFEFNFPNEDEEILIVDDDLSSTITNLESYTTESTSNSEEILLNLDESALEEAQNLYNDNIIEENIDWEDIDFEEEKSEIEPIITRIIEENNDNYQINNVSNQSLTSCVVLDMINGKIQCCTNKTKNQRPLAQLIGTWEIDNEMFTNTKVDNKLHTLGVCITHYNFDQNALHNLKLKQERSIEKS